MKKIPVLAQNYSTVASLWFWILHHKHKHLLPLHPIGFIIAWATQLLAGRWRVWTGVVEKKVSLEREAVQV